DHASVPARCGLPWLCCRAWPRSRRSERRRPQPRRRRSPTLLSCPCLSSASAEGPANRLLEVGECRVIIVDRVDAADLCLLVLAARGGDVEERRGTHLVPLLHRSQLLRCLHRGLLLQLYGFRRGDQRQVCVRYVSGKLKVSRSQAVRRVIALYARLLDLRFPLVVVEDGEGQCRADTDRVPIELEGKLVVPRTYLVNLRLRQSRRSAIEG